MSLVENALKKAQQTLAAQRHRSAAAAAEEVAAAATSVPKPTEPIAHKSINFSLEDLEPSGLVPPKADQRRMRNEYRQVKRPLIAGAFGRGVPVVPDGRLLMVASAVSGEGKTFTTLHLALSLAHESDLTVLLVDADLAKPHISKVFGIQGEPGLINALTDPAIDVETLVIDTKISKLSVLSAGVYVEHATELLASDRMRRVASRLIEADQRRIVVFDSPPLLLTAESRVLTEVAGQIVFVVRAEVTDRGAVIEAVSTIAEGKVVYAVLNQSHVPFGGMYYGYAYGEDGVAMSTPVPETGQEKR